MVVGKGDPEIWELPILIPRFHDLAFAHQALWSLYTDGRSEYPILKHFSSNALVSIPWIPSRHHEPLPLPPHQQITNASLTHIPSLQTGERKRSERESTVLNLKPAS